MTSVSGFDKKEKKKLNIKNNPLSNAFLKTHRKIKQTTGVNFFQNKVINMLGL